MPRRICMFNDDDVEVADHNLESGADMLNSIVDYTKDLSAHMVIAYITGLENEFGYVGVRGCNGGLTRVY